MKIEDGVTYMGAFGRRIGPMKFLPDGVFPGHPYVGRCANEGMQRYSEDGKAKNGPEYDAQELFDSSMLDIAGVAQKAQENSGNPKDLIGSVSLPVNLWPASATAYGCIGILNGKLKYGGENYSATQVRAMVYADAAIRHITDWVHGFDDDPKDLVPNLAGALANLGILVEALSNGTLIDDRKYAGDGWRVARAKMEPHVKRLQEFHKDRDPKHYTIKDRK